MAREKKKKDEGGGGAPLWVVTFGDMMSLLLTFFVLLLSFSTIQEEEFNKAAMSLRGALGVLPENVSVIAPNLAKDKRRHKRDAEEILRRLRRELQLRGQQDNVQVELDEQGGIKLNLPSHVLFDSARADLKPGALPVLAPIAGILVELPNAIIEARGHTDNRPLTSTRRYRNNHELSYHRAYAVAEFLSQRGPIPLTQFEIVALGPRDPVATNETPEGRQANRRVELFVRGEFSEERVDEIREQLDELPDLEDSSEPQ